jgi:hypothetical protein
VGERTAGEKDITFFRRNTPQIAISMVILPFWSSRNLTGESGVRGKTGSSWVRKVLIVLPINDMYFDLVDPCQLIFFKVHGFEVEQLGQAKWYGEGSRDFFFWFRWRRFRIAGRSVGRENLYSPFQCNERIRIIELVVQW